MELIEIEGKTVEEALNKALNKLNVDKNNVVYEVLNYGSKGLFNVIGVKPAKIRVSIKYNYIKEARNFLEKIFDIMDVKVKISITEDNNLVNINLSGDKVGVIIGYRGETLDSIQYLVSLVINREHDLIHKQVILDTENYRQKREETLKQLAFKTANKVSITGRIFKLEPMNPYERRIIHSALQGNDMVKTHSEGEEPFRRIVIELKK